MKNQTKKTKQIKKKVRPKNMMKKTMICTMLALTLVPTFSSFLPQDKTAQVDPKLAQAYLEAMNQAEEIEVKPVIEGTYEVVEVPSDTSIVVLYEGIQRTVKLIGVDDTQDVTNDSLEMLLSDNYVDLEFDTQREDEAGNLLAYVYLEDGRFLNEELLRNGQAILREETENVKYQDVLKKAQEDAEVYQSGVWRESIPEE